MKERDYNRLASRDSEGILDFNQQVGTS
jgi:hypothetical protein